MKKLNKNIVSHFIAVFIILSFWILFSFMFPTIYLRFWQALKEAGINFVYYVQEIAKNLFDNDPGWNVQSTINESNYFDGFSIGFLPDDFNAFSYQLSIFFKNFIIADFWLDFLSSMGDFFQSIARFAFFAVPLVFLLWFVGSRYFSYHDSNVGYVSEPLKKYRKLAEARSKAKEEMLSFFEFFRSKKYYWITAIFSFMFFTNVITILICAFSYYLYLSVSLNLISAWRQIVRLYFDVSFMFRIIYLPMWIYLIYFVLKRFLIAIASAKKSSVLAFVYNFVKNILGLMTLIVGIMSRGKTQLMTYLSLIYESWFKQVALERMEKKASYFPSEDFRSFEVLLDRYFSQHKIYNLATCRKRLREEILDSSMKEKTISNGVRDVSLWDVYFDYGQLYFIYWCPTSTIIGNYAVRSGLFALAADHLVQYVDDFMSSNSFFYENSNFSHIFDDNNYRMLKPIDFRLEWSYAVDIGIVLKDEVGKDRKNQVESSDIKKEDVDANQKNDGYNFGLKLGRHPSTVDNFCFWRYLSAEQRPDSVPADFRELNDYIIDIKKDYEEKNLFPFYSFIDWLIDFPYRFLKKYFRQYRFNRDENTLIFQFLKNGISKIDRYRDYMKNIYGIKILPIDLLYGNEEKAAEYQFPMLNSVLYSRRYSSDAYAAIFEERGEKSLYGINDIPEYQNERATIEELALTNQYFIRDLLKVRDSRSLNKKPSDSKKTKYKKVTYRKVDSHYGRN